MYIVLLWLFVKVHSAVYIHLYIGQFHFIIMRLGVINGKHKHKHKQYT